MPLSDDEQKILRQIEAELEQDPSFAERGYRVSRRRLVMSVLGMVVGLFVTVIGLAVSFLVSFAAFAVVLALGSVALGEIRLIGREQIGDLPIRDWLSSSRPPSRD